jgi:hypothetical protein
VIPVLVLGVTREGIDERMRRVTSKSTLPPPLDPPPSRPRSAARRQLPLILIPLLVIVVVAGAVLLPRLLPAAETPARSPAVQTVALAGDDWQIPRWTAQANSGGDSFGPSTWRIDGECSASTPCLLQVLTGGGPDQLYSNQLKAAVLRGPPRELRLSGSGGDFTASTTYAVSCSDSADDYPTDVTDTIDVHVLESVVTATGPVATSIAITWTSVITPGPAALQIGCEPSTFVYGATGTRTA